MIGKLIDTKYNTQIHFNVEKNVKRLCKYFLSDIQVRDNEKTNFKIYSIRSH